MTTTPTETTESRTYQLRPDLLRHFESNPGKTIYIDDLIKLRPDASKSGIQNATRALTTIAPIEILTAGRAWRYRADWPTPSNTPVSPAPVSAPPPPSDEVVLFRKVGVLANGAIILEDEDSKTYIAKPFQL